MKMLLSLALVALIAIPSEACWLLRGRGRCASQQVQQSRVVQSVPCNGGSCQTVQQSQGIPFTTPVYQPVRFGVPVQNCQNGRCPVQ